jgi:hypothetical protein
VKKYLGGCFGTRLAYMAGLVALSAVACQTASASAFSFTGTLPSPGDDYVEFIMHLNLSGVVNIQTYGFGGGTNVASQLIPAGGFDPFVGVFSGTGGSAVFIDGTSDALSNYTSEPGACPPAGTVFINATYGSQCGDVRMEFNTGAGFDATLTAGTYTVILSDALYYPDAATDPSVTTLGGAPFQDFTAGAISFSTCYDPSTCIADTGNWAIDIEGGEGFTATQVVVPEPATLILAGAGLLAIGCARRRRSRQNR